MARPANSRPSARAEVATLTELAEHTVHRVSLLEAEREQARMATEGLRRDFERLLFRLAELERKLQEFGKAFQ